MTLWYTIHVTFVYSSDAQSRKFLVNFVRFAKLSCREDSYTGLSCRVVLAIFTFLFAVPRETYIILLAFSFEMGVDDHNYRRHRFLSTLHI